MTVTFLVNAAGGKETAIVIWKSAKPRCFKSIDVNNLPVSQPKAWTTADILVSVLTKLNQKFSSGDRRVILLMDNAGCHLEHSVKDRFSNIRVIIFYSKYHIKVTTFRSRHHSKLQSTLSHSVLTLRPFQD